MERGLTPASMMFSRVMGVVEEHGICAPKTLKRARKPRAEALEDDLFEETCKKPALGPSVLCIHDKPKYSHPPPLPSSSGLETLTRRLKPRGWLTPSKCTHTPPQPLRGLGTSEHPDHESHQVTSILLSLKPMDLQ